MAASQNSKNIQIAGSESQNQIGLIDHENFLINRKSQISKNLQM